MPSALTVEREVAAQRLAICRKCKHYRQGVRPTCGTPIVGEEVTYRGKKRRTCGCFLDLKVKFAGTACPLGKWGRRKDEDALLEAARALMAEINPGRITVDQHRELARLYPQLVARRTTVQRCARPASRRPSTSSSSICNTDPMSKTIKLASLKLYLG